MSLIYDIDVAHECQSPKDSSAERSQGVIDPELSQRESQSPKGCSFGKKKQVVIHTVQEYWSPSPSADKNQVEFDGEECDNPTFYSVGKF